MASSYRREGTKREEFRKYLVRAGIQDVLIKAVVELYEEPDKPPNPLEFIRRLLQGGSPESPGVETLRQEATELRAKNAELVEENTDLKARIEQLQTQQSYEEQKDKSGSTEEDGVETVQ